MSELAPRVRIFPCRNALEGRVLCHFFDSQDRVLQLSRPPERKSGIDLR